MTDIPVFPCGACAARSRPGNQLTVYASTCRHERQNVRWGAEEKSIGIALLLPRRRNQCGGLNEVVFCSWWLRHRKSASMMAGCF